MFKKILIALTLTSALFSTTTLANETKQKAVYLFTKLHMKNVCDDLMDNSNRNDFDARIGLKNICVQELFSKSEIDQHGFMFKIPVDDIVSTCTMIESRALKDVDFIYENNLTIKESCQSKIQNIFELRVDSFNKSKKIIQDSLIKKVSGD